MARSEWRCAGRGGGDRGRKGVGERITEPRRTQVDAHQHFQPFISQMRSFHFLILFYLYFSAMLFFSFTISLYLCRHLLFLCLCVYNCALFDLTSCFFVHVYYSYVVFIRCFILLFYRFSRYFCSGRHFSCSLFQQL